MENTGANFAEAPIASVPGGFFQNNFQIELTSASPNADIRFTLSVDDFHLPSGEGEDEIFGSLTNFAKTEVHTRGFVKNVLMGLRRCLCAGIEGGKALTQNRAVSESTPCFPPCPRKGIASGFWQKLSKNQIFKLNLFPNPVNERLAIQFFTKEKGTVGLTIVSPLGVEVFQEKMKLQKGGHHVEMDVSKLKSGAYTLLVNAEGMKRRAVQFVRAEM